MQRYRIVVLHQEGYSERLISLAEHYSKTAVLRRIAMRSPQSSSKKKKMRSALLQKDMEIFIKTVKQRLAKDFGLKAFKPAKKLRPTPAMKLKRIQFAQKHVN